ncbi:uncharacterized protein LY89DRAFT_300658 [Mollisia scopiformis]|uniref:Uncharacterized protein n=1 Tax=Mollisia scopiformis TaxID=149040 RepID=A0A194XQL4_MOLSC|nr:uncharacterized protein LY89DRAFT_300658 [Mollisia scopiformis]KUJ22488.1 hypothetical protein LY89DRAFT_300658 [Mollisia scopiformis]
MKSFFTIGFTATFATLAMAESTAHRSLHQSKIKRGFLTCEQTYGGGSITCGAVDSHYCYNPTVGESCCPLDDGYCGKGDFCAPVAGYCCHDTESPGVCAARLSFTLPTSYDVSSVPVATAPPASASISAAPELPTSTIQIALAPGPPSAVAIGFGDIVSTTTQGTLVPEMTARVNLFNLTTATVTSTADGIATSAPTYLQASGAASNAKACFGAMIGIIGFVFLVL